MRCDRHKSIAAGRAARVDMNASNEKRGFRVTEAGRADFGVDHALSRLRVHADGPVSAGVPSLVFAHAGSFVFGIQQMTGGVNDHTPKTKPVRMADRCLSFSGST